jgi:hypothetical protein
MQDEAIMKEADKKKKQELRKTSEMLEEVVGNKEELKENLKKQEEEARVTAELLVQMKNACIIMKDRMEDHDEEIASSISQEISKLVEKAEEAEKRRGEERRALEKLLETEKKYKEFLQEKLLMMMLKSAII